MKVKVQPKKNMNLIVIIFMMKCVLSNMSSKDFLSSECFKYNAQIKEKNLYWLTLCHYFYLSFAINFATIH